MVKDILLFLDDGKSNLDRINAAITLCKRHDAWLTGAVLGSMKPVHAPVSGAEADARMGSKMAERLLEEFSQISEAQNQNYRTMTIYGDSASSSKKMGQYARNYDLVILRQPNPKYDNYSRLQEFAKQVLLLSGRPILFLPYIGFKKEPVKKVLIAWDGTPSVSRTVHDAIPLLRQAKEVCMMIVLSKKQVSSKSDVNAEQMAYHLGHHGIKVVLKKISPGTNSVTSVIQNQISDHNYDMLIMGGHGTPTLKQKILGTVTKNLLSSMPVPLLLSN